MVVFGDQTQHVTDYGNENIITGMNAATSVAGVADSMFVYFDCTTSVKDGRCMIYSADRTTLIGTSDEVSIQTGTGWTEFPFTDTVNLAASTTYYIVSWVESTTGVCEYHEGTDAGVTQTYAAYSYAGGPPSDISGHTTYSNTSNSIYCTYSEAGPPPSGTGQYINKDDTWRELSEAWVNKDDTWRQVTESWTNKDDTWRRNF